jgi:hypothetical protein
VEVSKLLGRHTGGSKEFSELPPHEVEEDLDARACGAHQKVQFAWEGEETNDEGRQRV